jgi:ribonuclease HI
MADLKLFTDGSVNTRSKIGYGAYLVVTEDGLPLDILKKQVKLKVFEDTTSTRLELQTLLWALNEIQAQGNKVVVYTDSRNILGLPGRRYRLEKNDYRSKNNRQLTNSDLYQEFFRLTGHLNCEFVKVEGHQRSDQKDDIARIFTLVDRASRKTVRGDNRK